MQPNVDLAKLQALVAEGWLRVQIDPDTGLRIYNYTEHCQFARHWTPETRMCRGLITDDYGAIVALPFPKFFNYGEEMPDPAARLWEITEKLDGSLGILYWVGPESPKVATRGSFTSDQATWATAWLAEHCKTHENLYNLPRHLTLLWEIIYPANRVVVDYEGVEDLVLIGARNMLTGRDYTHQQLTPLAQEFGFNQPRSFPLRSVEDCLEAAKTLPASQEGWVLRYNDGSRFKIKGEQYKIAHKLLTGINFNRVLEAMSTGVLDQMLEGVPDEFLTTIKEYQAQIIQTTNAARARIETEWAAAPKGSRKELALWAREHCPDDLSYLFTILDNKPLTPVIYKHEFKREATDGEQGQNPDS